MSISTILPQVKELPHSDKLLLLHFLVTEILQESNLVPLDTQGKVTRQGLHDSFEAAAVLAQALTEEKVAIHG